MLQYLKANKIITIYCILLSIFSCKKNDSPAPQSSSTTSNDMLTDIATNVIYAINLDLYNKATSLDSAMKIFAADPSASNLANVKTGWYQVRKTYELSEAVIFGPSVYLEVDPNVDTWPVDTSGVNHIINGSDILTPQYVANLDPTLKGYHMVEFLLFGGNGQKQWSQFSARQLQLLTSLTADGKSNTYLLKSTWNPAEGNYVSNFTYAGTSGKSSYASQKAAFQEIVGTMQGIADQIANQKIENSISPAPNPTLQESQFSDNTMTDIVNNVQGIKNVYFGKYLMQSLGVHDWLAPRNSKLDSAISVQINNALTAVSNIPCSFTEAIYPASPCNAQLISAKDAINTLNVTLRDQLIPYINQTVDN